MKPKAQWLVFKALLRVVALLGLTWPMAAAAEVTAFKNVSVVPMDSPVVLLDQTVIVVDERITSVSPAAETLIPEAATIVDGSGAYLMPGLVDMHAHLEMRDSDPRSLLLFLAEGTTALRSPSGRTLNRTWRDSVERGELDGPTILTAGKVMFGLVANDSGHNGYVTAFRFATLLLPLVIGAAALLIWRRFVQRKHEASGKSGRSPVPLWSIAFLALLGIFLFATKTPRGAIILPYLTDLPIFISEKPDQVAAEVRRQHRQGVDFVKPYDGLSIPEYLEAIAEANRLGIYVLGHALDQASLETILTSGIDEIAHLDELNFYHWRGEFGSEDFFLDYEAIPQTVAMMKKNNVNIVSNLSLDEALINMIFEPEETLARPEYRVVRPEQLEDWRVNGRQNRAFAEQGPYRRDMEMDFYFALVKALNEMDVIVTIGTDTAPFTEGSLPSHIHRELELLVMAGFSNYDALSAGTRNAAEIFARMGADGSFGVISAGQRADMILLKDNPLENVSATRDRLGLMVRGKWMPQEELNDRVTAFVAEY